MPVLTLVGNSELTKEKRVKELLKVFGGSYTKIHPDDNDKLEVIAASLKTFGMFGTKNVVDIIDLDSWKAKEKKELRSLLSSVPEDVLIIIRTKKAIKGFKAEKYELPKPWERDKWISFIEEKLKEKGLKASKEVIEFFLDSVGNDEFRIETELEKLSLYTQGEITAEDIEKVAYKSTIPAIDELTFAMSEKRFDQAHKLVEEVLKGAEVIVVSASVAKHFIDLLRIKVHVKEKDKYSWPDVSNYSRALSIPIPKMARFLGFKFKGWKNIPFNHVKAYSKEWLSEIAKRLFSLDRAIKMTEKPEVALHDFIEFLKR